MTPHKAYNEVMAGISAKSIEEHMQDRSQVSVGQEQIKVNHRDCPAGTDTKQRLYIKQLSSSQYIAYCHHCGLSGAFFKQHARPNSDSLRKYLLGEKDKLVERVKQGDFDTTYVAYVSGINPAADSYLAKLPLIPDTKKIFQGVEHWYGKPREYIAYRLHTWHGRQVGEQRRFFDENGPKARTLINPEYNQGAAIYFREDYKEEEKPTLVLVEDPLSAMRIAESSGLDALCLLGSSLKGEAESDIMIRNYSRIVVWMDKDAAGESGAKKIMNRLTHLNAITLLNKEGRPVELLDATGKQVEPKDYSGDCAVRIASLLVRK